MVHINPLWDAKWQKHLCGGSVRVGSPVPPLPCRARSSPVGAWWFFCLNQQRFLSPAGLNIRFNWGSPAYQRHYGNFYEGKCGGKVFAWCCPGSSLPSPLPNAVLSHCPCSPGAPAPSCCAGFGQDGEAPAETTAKSEQRETFLVRWYLFTHCHAWRAPFWHFDCVWTALEVFWSRPSSSCWCASLCLQSRSDLHKIYGWILYRFNTIAWVLLFAGKC